MFKCVKRIMAALALAALAVLPTASYAVDPTPIEVPTLAGIGLSSSLVTTAILSVVGLGLGVFFIMLIYRKAKSVLTKA